MRISDWSSDVCSSDLPHEHATLRRKPDNCLRNPAASDRRAGSSHPIIDNRAAAAAPQSAGSSHRNAVHSGRRLDRKSVVEGKSVSVRVDLGGRRIIKKQQNETAIRSKIKKIEH